MIFKKRRDNKRLLEKIDYFLEQDRKELLVVLGRIEELEKVRKQIKKEAGA